MELGTSEIAEQKLAYLPENPIRAGFVDDPAHYLYSSERDCAGQRGLLPGLMFLFG
jgi:putative transposase